MTPYNIALYLPTGRNDDAVSLFMAHLARTWEQQGHWVSFIEADADGIITFHGKRSPEDIHFGVFLNSNYPAIKDRATGEHLKQVPIGLFPHIALLTLPYYFEIVYSAAIHAERLKGIFYFDKNSIVPIFADSHLHLEPPVPSYYSATPLPSQAPPRKLLYAANLKGTDALSRIFTEFPDVASQSRQLLKQLSEDFTLSVPAIVSDMLGMEYRAWVQQTKWRAYAEILQKVASLFDRFNTLRALSNFPCHYVLNATKVPVRNFHPDSTFSGPISFDRLLDLYDQHGGIVANLPSRIPNVLSERVTNAMVHGVLPIVPSKGDHLSYLNAGNVIFHNETMSSIREAIQSFLDLDNETRLTMARNAHATAMECFSPQAFAARIVAAYEKVM